MQRTQNYNLCQWAAEDRILRSDFNADNQKIDAALKAANDAASAAASPADVSAAISNACPIITGSYTGTGATTTTHFTLGKRPKLVMIFAPQAEGQNDQRMIFATETAATCLSYNYSYFSAAYITFTDDGFDFAFGNITGADSQGFNLSGRTYCYWALC